MPPAVTSHGAITPRDRHLGQKFAFLGGRRTADRIIMASNRDNPGKRLIVVEGDEVEALYGRPRFTHEERGQYFALSPNEKAVLDRLHSVKSRAYFILQLGYFKAR